MTKITASNKLLIQFTLYLFISSVIAMLALRLFSDEVDTGIMVAIVFISAVTNARWLIKEASETNIKS